LLYVAYVYYCQLLLENQLTAGWYLANHLRASIGLLVHGKSVGDKLKLTGGIYTHFGDSHTTKVSEIAVNQQSGYKAVALFGML